MYALKAATGAVVWRSLVALPSATVSDYFNWSSPTVVNGHVYISVPIRRTELSRVDCGRLIVASSHLGDDPPAW